MRWWEQSCMPIIGAIPLGLAYVAEILPIKYKWTGAVVGNHLFGNVLGGVVPTLFSLFLLSDPSLSWKYYVIACTVPSMISFVLLFVILKETPTQLVAKGKIDEAEKEIRRLAKSNKVELPQKFSFRKNEKNGLGDESELPFRGALADAFKNWGLMRVLICVVMIGNTSQFVVYAIHPRRDRFPILLRRCTDQNNFWAWVYKH